MKANWYKGKSGTFPDIETSSTYKYALLKNPNIIMVKRVLLGCWVPIFKRLKKLQKYFNVSGTNYRYDQVMRCPSADMPRC